MKGRNFQGTKGRNFQGTVPGTNLCCCHRQPLSKDILLMYEHLSSIDKMRRTKKVAWRLRLIFATLSQRL